VGFSFDNFSGEIIETMRVGKMGVTWGVGGGILSVHGWCAVHPHP
jgi:hypothetical protein